MATFHSPASTAPERDPRGGINVSGLPFPHPAESATDPFGFRTPLPSPWLTPEGSGSMPSARCRLLSPAATKPPWIFAPLLGFHPFRS
jgi:hypothetical protein